jgi:hypothetical protein
MIGSWRTFLDVARIEEFPAPASGTKIRRNEPGKSKWADFARIPLEADIPY